LDELSGPQLSEWEAYDRLDPIGAWRDDFGIATLVSAMTNIVRSLYWDEEKYGKAKMTGPADFMPGWDKEQVKSEPIRQSVEEMRQVMYTIAGANKKKERKLHNRPPKGKDKK